ncbi:PAP2-domain-containing protein [Mytilinidion resinicola]|uniref:PAP2-domain-containing protein n=1 Tax=Mytilinidion resinicola TaxID=574789 RepID=A0A6A6Z3N6_9PEZI|nr:PAP2-domain-containing protein [Mytilinidion resinicola]KAF2814867.1 PAP2-domain-containing protein [Mytilinidion resinicola]
MDTGTWKAPQQLPERLPFSKKKIPKKVMLSYILDYVIIIVLIAGFFALDAVEPFHQHFSLQNYTLHYPYAEHERVPVAWLVVIACFGPAVVIAVYTLVIDGLFSHQVSTTTPAGRRRKLTGKYRMKDRLWELNCGILGLALAVGASFVIVGALKNAIGKPRPDLIARCKPNTQTDPPGLKLSDHSICTNKDNAVLKDGFRSFPSGHSSTAFAGLFYLSIYLVGKMHVLDSKGEVWKTFIILIPTLGAALIAGSRIMDARHHPFDVLSGSALGILVAWGAYRQYFPPVTEPWKKGRAYPIRAWGKAPVAPVPMAQVEEDVQPLQPRALDAERGHASGFSSPTAVVGSGETEPNTNVFRAQISASQRSRDGTAYRGAPSSAYSTGPPERHNTNVTASSTYTGTLPASNPFAPRDVSHDPYGYSSSEEDDSYELQPTYTLSNPHGGPPVAYDPAFGHGQDTSYHAQATSPVPTPPPLAPTARKPLASDASGDIGEGGVAPPQPPVHAAGTTGEFRGVQLTETYAK